MENGKPSETARLATLMRAAHVLLDGEPKILEDRFALRFLGESWEGLLLDDPESFRTDELNSVRAFVVLRNRYAEDRLEEAVRRDVVQYVLLGAGLDFFALRRPDFSDVLRVFEVDHPWTQQWKRDRLEELKLDSPGNLTYVPVDFEKQRFTEALASAGFRFDKPAFFSWLGVTQYLTRDAVFGTLRQIAETQAPGSQIVFQYCVPDSMLSEEDGRPYRLARENAARCGEHWLSLFEPDSLASHLERMGFDPVLDFGPEEAFDRYFREREDGLRPLKSHRLMNAVLPRGDRSFESM